MVTTLEVNSQLRVGPTAPPQDRDAADCGRAAVVWGGVSPAARGNDATLRTKCRETAGNVRENGWKLKENEDFGLKNGSKLRETEKTALACLVKNKQEILENRWK